MDLDYGIGLSAYMVDTLSRERRSWLMGRVPHFDTKPEMAVRKMLYGMGYRYRLHRKDLPGRPDIALPKMKKAIFVHGCFWHRHDCKKATTPKSNGSFWLDKFDQNVKRDRKALADLSELGWEAVIVWECEVSDLERLADKLANFLEHANANPA